MPNCEPAPHPELPQSAPGSSPRIRHQPRIGVREAFKDLLKDWGRSHDLIFIPEYEHTTPDKRRYVDGALLHALRIPFGYWEAKDEEDDLDKKSP